MTKQIFSLLLAMMLTFSGLSTVSAAEAATAETTSTITQNAIVKAPAIYNFSGYTSTNWSTYNPIWPSSSGSFGGSITVKGACTLYLMVYNSSQTLIGTSSLQMTKAGKYTITPSPSYVSAGTYYVRYRFSVNGVQYDMNLHTP